MIVWMEEMAYRFTAASAVVAGSSLFAAYRFFIAPPISEVTPKPSIPSCRERFDAFAAIECDGEKFLSLSDFGDSLTRSGKSNHDAPEASRNLAEVMNKFDENQDGKLSYTEYCALSTLAAATPDTISKAFLLHCDPTTKKISAGQLHAMMQALVGDPSVRLVADVNSSPLIKGLFAKTSSMDFNSLMTFIDDVETAVVKYAFQSSIPSGISSVSLKKFRRIVLHRKYQDIGSDSAPVREASAEVAAKSSVLQLETRSTEAPNTTHYVKDRKGKLRKVRSGFDEVDLVNIVRLLKTADNWIEPLVLYLGNNPEATKIDKAVLHRAFVSANMANVSPRTSGLLFDVFDTDGSGTLSLEEIRGISEAHSSWFSLHRREFDVDRTFGQRFVKCMQQE